MKVSDEIANYVKNLFPNDTTENNFKTLIENEFIRRLALYKLTVRNLENKYKMDFIEFKTKNIVEQNDYSFEIENDFYEWEMAIDRIRTIEKK